MSLQVHVWQIARTLERCNVPTHSLSQLLNIRREISHLIEDTKYDSGGCLVR